MYSVDREKLLELCHLFPKAAVKLQTYCINQVKHLSNTRRMMTHLHVANFNNHFYRKK